MPLFELEMEEGGVGVLDWGEVSVNASTVHHERHTERFEVVM